MTDQWIGLDFRHLTALRAIADEDRSRVRRASSNTPSAISQQIAGLERVVGVVGDRAGARPPAVGLTEAGRILLRHMSAIEARLHTAKSEIDALAEGTGGQLHVGAFESVRTASAEVIARYRDLYPHVRVEVDEALSDLDCSSTSSEGCSTSRSR